MTDPRRTLAAARRLASARIPATLARLVRDVGLAEELAQDTMVIALEQWPSAGVPDHPASWLMATAKHRAIDALRRQSSYQQKLQEVGRALEASADEPDLDDYVGDDLL